MPVITSEFRMLRPGRSQGSASSRATASVPKTSPPRPPMRNIERSPRWTRGKESAGAPQQHRQQQRQRQGVGEQRGNVARRQLLGHAQKQAARDRADEAAHAADGDGYESKIGRSEER